MIRLEKISLRRGSKIVLNNAEAIIQPGEKVGLIGRNGAGKSSLFALLLGQLQEEKGHVQLPAQWVIAQVQQDMPESESSATDFVLTGDMHLMVAQDALAQAQLSNDGIALAQAHVLLDEAQAFNAKSRAQTLLMGLGFTKSQLNDSVNQFSGGWRMRLQLARALMAPADLLLLDEPTNHLDLDALVWLEDWLKNFQGTLLVISHDRVFLDTVCKVTLHLNNGKLTRYGSNYSGFEILQSQALALQKQSYQKQQIQITHLENFISRFKAKASKAKQAQSRVKALERMERLAPVLSLADFSFSFKEPDAVPNLMLSLKKADLGYGKNVVLENINFKLLAKQRIGILGANGQGKSTFIKSIAHSLPLLNGSIVFGKGLKIGYFAQHEMDLLDVKDTPIKALTRLNRQQGEGQALAKEQELRNFLGQFQFSGDLAQQSISSLSGGEKARLVLCLLAWQKPNLLLLDEPTNHLDLTTRQALSLALNQFDGTVILVSHDRALLTEVCNTFLLVAANQILPFNGDLDDYKEYLFNLAKERREASRKLKNNTYKKSAKEERQTAAKARAQLQPIKAKLDQTDQQLKKHLQNQKILEEQLQTQTDQKKLIDDAKRLKDLNQKIAKLEDDWLFLSHEIEEKSL